MLHTVRVLSTKKRWLILALLALALAASPVSLWACLGGSGGAGGDGGHAGHGGQDGGVMCAEPDAGSCVPSGQNSGPGCTRRRWIGYFTGAPNVDCAANVPGLDLMTWKAGPLFQGAESEVLGGYCLYTFAGMTAPDPNDISAFQDAGLAEDCVTVGGMSPLEDTRQELRTFFVNAAGRPPNGLPPLDGGRSTAVAVVDTQTNAGHFTNDHGAIVSGVIRDLACADGGPCLVAIDRELGLPHTDNDATDYNNGGSFGTPGQLAQGIYWAVDRWKLLNYGPDASADHPRLVLNLSVGWQPGNDCGYDIKALSCSARAVYDAIRYAACEGVLVVAAAGNSPGGPKRREILDAEPSDAMAPMFVEVDNPSAGIDGGTCPGAWTVIAAPSDEDCKCLISANDPVSAQSQFPLRDPDAGNAPLLVAVAGVDYRDGPLANARKGARPPYAALGVLATTDLDALDGGLPPPITGSSIGAAVWSAIAASAWSYSPAKTREKIINDVYDNSSMTDAGAEMVIDGGPPGTRRASLCSAINLPCTPGVLDESVPTVLTNLDAILDGGAALDAASSSDASPFVLLQTTQALSWVHPQPEVNPCGVCFLNPTTGAFVIYVNPGYNLSIQEITIRDGANASSSFGVTYPLQGGDTLRLNAVPAMVSPEVSFRVSGPVNGALIEGSVIAQPFLAK